MSSSVGEEAIAAVLTKLLLSLDGAVLGIALAYATSQTLIKLKSTSSALRQIQSAPLIPIADLRSLIDDEDQKLVVVRGAVDAKAFVEKDWGKLSSVLVSHEGRDRGVILQRTQTCIYHEWKGILRFSHELQSLFARKQQKSSSVRTIPFVLADVGSWNQSKYVIVNMDGSRHPLPLVTVYNHLQPVTATPYTFMQALFGHEYPVGLLDEEKILPLGKEITAVGFCSLKSGTPEIKSSKDLPYFLSDMSKDQMVQDLAFKSKVLIWIGVVLGSVAVGVLSYAAMRNWIKFKEWRQRRLARQARLRDTTESNDPEQIISDDEIGEVPDGELCVICLTRRRRSAFVPCGHLVCCQRCALRVECEGDKKCPVCMQPFLKSVRIYNS